MISKISSASLYGLEGDVVSVETDISPGLPGFFVAGLAGTAIREAQHRVRAALCTNGFDYPSRKITINLVPAGRHKEGSHFDLAIALGILDALGQLHLPRAKKECRGQETTSLAEEAVFLGELSLGGELVPIRGALPLAMCAYEQGFRKVIVPYENRGEVGLLDDVTVFACHTLREVVALVCGEEGAAEKVLERSHAMGGKAEDSRHRLLQKESQPDYLDVVGQEAAKRAMVICAAGAHGVLLAGNPGCGKSMLAARLVTILPPMSKEEKMEVTKLYSVAGLLSEELPYVRQRPFRSPHHTVTAAALLGGGRIPKPGEISLAHHGILFLDELGEFDRKVLDGLRQPLEEEKVTVARNGGAASFPCRTIPVAATNPCRCGHLGDPYKACTCSPREIATYQSKLSGPLMDRVDMHVAIPHVSYGTHGQGLSSAQMQAMVLKARRMQENRFAATNLRFNAHIGAAELERYCVMNQGAKELLHLAGQNLGLSMRASHKVAKLARTIADLEESDIIKEEHMAEAIGYRRKE